MAKEIVALLFVLGLFAFVSSISYTDEVMAERVYCLNYFNLIHPDYKDLVQTGMCNKYLEY